MERKSIDDRAEALRAVQRQVSATRGRDPSEPAIIKVRRDNGFYDSLPWDQVQYFSEDVGLATPGFVGGAATTIYNYNVPSGQVLDITSVVFRAGLIVAEDPINVNHTFGYAGDGYLLGRGFFTFRVAGTSMFARQLDEPAWLAAQLGDVYNTLNQDIMIPQFPFHVFANQGADVTAEFTWSNAAFPATTPLTQLITEVRGLLMPKVLFDKLAKEFSS